MNTLFVDINWETVLVASIIPVFGLIGIIYKSYSDKKAAKAGNDATTANRREPSWVELDEANRKLRQEVDDNKEDAERRIKALEDRFETFVNKTNTRIGALSNMLHASAQQWPTDHPGPYFLQEDLDALENTDVPFVWRNRVRPYQ